MTVLLILTWIGFISVLGAGLTYGILAPWWRSRTGIGFLSTKLSFSVVIGLTLCGFYGILFPMWVYWGAWLLVIVTINYGITFNIIYKQFIEKNPDLLRWTAWKAWLTRRRETTKGKAHG